MKNNNQFKTNRMLKWFLGLTVVVTPLLMLANKIDNRHKDYTDLENRVKQTASAEINRTNKTFDSNVFSYVVMKEANEPKNIDYNFITSNSPNYADTNITKESNEPNFSIVDSNIANYTDINNIKEANEPNVSKLETKVNDNFLHNKKDTTIYDGIIFREANKRDQNPYFVKAQIKQESGFNPNAVSSSGAIGLSQFMPDTARDLGYSPIDMYNPEKAIEAQTRYNQKISLNFKEFNEEEIKKFTLASYNAGPRYIKDSIEMLRAANMGAKTYDVVKFKGGGSSRKKIVKTVDITELRGCKETWEDGYSKALKLINPIDSHQTIEYVNRIMRYYNEYKETDKN